MSSIKIASNFINAAWYVSGTLADYAHLQLVLGGNEYEVQAPFALSIPVGADWVVELQQSHSLNTVNFAHPDYYSSVSIELQSSQTDGYVWELFGQLRNWFFSQDIDYNYDQNSNSYIRALLYVVGVNLDAYLPSITLASMEDGFPGASRNVFFDLAGSSTPLHLWLDGTDGNDIIRSGIGNDTLYGADGNDTISTFSGDDWLSGVWGDDILDGGEGKDTIFGGAGDDFIFFDEQDLDFNGGTGFDTARYQQIGDHRALVIDMGAREIEVLITGNKADRVIATGEGPLLVSTGGGSDHITFQNGRGSPTIVMGGSGGDTYDVQVGTDSNDPIGILKIKVWGLTNDNLPHLTLDMLGMPANFDWSQIDLVMVNCDAQDRVTINGRQLRLETVSTVMNYTWTDGNTGETHVEDMGVLTETVFRQTIEGKESTIIWDRSVGNISSDFLNGSAGVFAPRISLIPGSPEISESLEVLGLLLEYRDIEGRTYLVGNGMPDEMIYDYQLGSPLMSSEWFAYDYGARAHYYAEEYIDPDWQPGSWFIYGGRIANDGTLSSSLTAVMPPDL